MTAAVPPLAAGQAAIGRAHPNLALIKYWGKSDEALSLPATGSLSLTLDVFPTTTRITLDSSLDQDVVSLNGVVLAGNARDRVSRILDLVRQMAGSSTHARVESENTGPTGAGLASSAAGFAALAVAADAAWGLNLDRDGLSRLARRGSGSASRSVISGVALWQEGDDETSVARPVAAPEMAMVIALVDAGPKAIPSRDAMRRTVETSPFYPAWVTSTREQLQAMVAACAAGDLPRIGELTESNALRMHATMAGALPPVRYLSPASIALFDRVAQLRADGVGAWATADAGPNVAALCGPADAQVVAAALQEVVTLEVPDGHVVIAGAGEGATLLEDVQFAAQASAMQVATPVGGSHR